MSKSNDLKKALTGATLALLSTQPALAQDTETTPQEQQSEATAGDWKFDAAFLYYGESDSRVQAVEPVFQATKFISEEEFLTFRLTADSLTGASPSGAVASNQPQTFTSPSGNADYSIPANTYPLDDTFKDTRVALATNWTFPVSDHTDLTIGGNFSNEYDYQSVSVNSNISMNFNQNNTTLFAGFSYANDTIDAVGGAPIALARMQPVGSLQAKMAGTENKDTLDVLFGVTQVIDRDSLFQLNYSYSNSDGYHNDPYKVLSVLDANGNYYDDGIATANVLFESRPDSRTKHSIFGRYKTYLDGDVLDLSYRYMTDDWEVDSQTVDAKYRFALSGDSYLQPHIRYYQQSKADFYRPYLRQSEAIPTFASADYRLAEYDATTVGLEYGWLDSNKNQWRVSLEFYQQSPTEPEKYGDLTSQTLLPDWNAAMLRVNYSF
jgi:hypothetical protein